MLEKSLNLCDDRADGRFEQVAALGENKKPNRTVRPQGYWLAGFLCTSFFLVFSGCKTKVFTDPILGPDYSATNAFRKWPVLPAELRRVAVLPLSYNEADATAVSGQQTLEPILQTELTKAGRFELIAVKPAQMQLWTGKERWDS